MGDAAGDAAKADGGDVPAVHGPVGPAAEADAVGMGGQIPGAVGREQRRAGAVAHGQGPYQREIMDAIGDHKTGKIIILSAAQIGKTDAFILNVIGYYMAYYPAPIMVMQPTLDMGQTFSKDRLAPMVRDTPELRGWWTRKAGIRATQS